LQSKYNQDYKFWDNQQKHNKCGIFLRNIFVNLKIYRFSIYVI